MQGSPSILSEHLIAFCHKFYKISNARAQKLNSIFYMTIKLLKNCIFGMNALRFCHNVHNNVMDIITQYY